MKYNIRQDQAVWQTTHWEVEALSKEEAEGKFWDGKAKFVFSDTDADAVDGMESELTIKPDAISWEAKGFIVADGTAIYGVGTTEEEARSDERQWSEGESDAIPIPATQALLDQVKETGGNLAWDIVGGFACTTHEADQWRPARREK